MLDIKTIWDWYRHSKDRTSKWRMEADECYQLAASHQWTDEELSYLREKQRQAITFDRIGPLLDGICGYQIHNRVQIKFSPREPGDIQVNEILTGAATWSEQQCDGEHEVSDAFRDLLICGMGWTESRLDYEDNPEGALISAERINPLEMYWDTENDRRNLRDCKYVQRAKWWDIEDAKERWPSLTDSALLMMETDEQTLLGIERIDYPPEQSDVINPNKRQVRVLQTQYTESDTIYRVPDMQTGQLADLSVAKYNAMKRMLEGLPVVKAKRMRYYQVFSVGMIELEHKPMQCQTGFTLIPMTGKRDQMTGDWYGIVRVVKDPQKWSNKFLSEIQDIMSTARRGGVYIEDGAVKDIRRFEEQFSKPGGVLELEPGGLKHIQERAMGDYPAGVERIMQIAVAAVPEVSGINQELLGMADRQQPGILEAQRKQAGLTILASYFDALNMHTKARGRVILFYIQNFLSDGRLVRITGQNGLGQYLPLVRDQTLGEYDIIVDSAPMSGNVKEQVLGVLTQFGPTLLQLMPQSFKFFLPYLPLPQALLDQLMQSVAQQEQMQAQMAQQLPNPQQLQAAAQQAEVENRQADTQVKLATADEKRANTSVMPMVHAIKSI